MQPPSQGLGVAGAENRVKNGKLMAPLKEKTPGGDPAPVFVGGRGAAPPELCGGPASEHWTDWFHITMRLTVLQQQTKGLQVERPETGADVSKRLESVKHLLWHGDAAEALERLGNLAMELSRFRRDRPQPRRSPTASSNSRRIRQGETISTALWNRRSTRW